jgi:hypothetical protein
MSLGVRTDRSVTGVVARVSRFVPGLAAARRRFV